MTQKLQQNKLVVKIVEDRQAERIEQIGKIFKIEPTGKVYVGDEVRLHVYGRPRGNIEMFPISHILGEAERYLADYKIPYKIVENTQRGLRCTPGQIVEHLPHAREQYRYGDTVTLVVCGKGAPVPNMIGQVISLNDIDNNKLRRDPTGFTTKMIGNICKGIDNLRFKISKQTPGAGETAPSGTLIELEIQLVADSLKVPDLLRYAESYKYAIGGSYYSGYSHVMSSYNGHSDSCFKMNLTGSQSGKPVKQTPAANTIIQQGTTVTIEFK